MKTRRDTLRAVSARLLSSLRKPSTAPRQPHLKSPLSLGMSLRSNTLLTTHSLHFMRLWQALLKGCVATRALSPAPVLSL